MYRVTLRLNAADGEHEAAGGVGPVGADGQHAGNVESTDDLAAGAQFDLVAQVEADQGVMHEQQAFAHRYAHVVGELDRGRAGAAFGAVDDDEVRQDPGFDHGLGDAHEFPGVTQAELEAHRLAAGQLAQLRNELHHFERRGKGAVTRWRDAVLAHGDTPRVSDFPGDLVLGQDAAVAGFGALTHLDFNHADLRVLRLFGKPLRVETAVFGAAAEIAAAQLPREVAAIFAVVRADAAFAGVMGEVAEFGAFVQRPDRIGAERTEAHGRNIEDRRRVRLSALRAADGDPELVRVRQRRRAHGMADEFEAGLINVDQGAERFVGRFIFGACIDQRTLRTGEGQGVAVGLQQVLADFRADRFDGVPDVAQNRIVTAHRVRDLNEVENTDQAENRRRERERPKPLVIEKRQAQQGEQYTPNEKGVAT